MDAVTRTRYAEALALSAVLAEVEELEPRPRVDYVWVGHAALIP